MRRTVLFLLLAGLAVLGGCLRPGTPGPAGPGDDDDDDVVGPTESRLVVNPPPAGVSITSNPVGIDCPAAACDAIFDRNTTVTLNADRGALCSQVTWSQIGCPAGDVCDVPLNDPNVAIDVGRQATFYRWARVMGGANGDVTGSIARVRDEIVIAGGFEGNADFGFPLSGNTGSSDAFAASFGADTGAPLWAYELGDTQTDHAHRIAADGNGVLTMIGVYESAVDFGGTTETAAGPADYFLVRLGPPAAGETTPTFLDYEVHGSAETDTLRGLAVDPGGRIFVVGYTNEASGLDPTGSSNLGDPVQDTTTTDMFIASYDAALGNADWAGGGYGDGGGGNGATNDESWAVASGNDNDPVMVGFFTGNPDFGGGTNMQLNGVRDFSVVKFNGNNGNLRWEQDSEGGDEYGYDVAVAFNTNDVYVAGRYSTSFGISGGGTSLNKGGAQGVDGVLVKLAGNDGDPIWANYFTGPGDNRVLTVDASDDGDVVVSGSFEQMMNVEVAGAVVDSVTANGGTDVFLARFDTTGTLEWLTSFGSTANDRGFNVAIEGDGTGVWLGGEIRGDVVGGLNACTLTAIGNDDVILLQVDPNGPPP